jgi:hypothetical protein
MRIEAKTFVTNLLAVRITIKKEEIGLSKEQFIQKRKIEREKARENAREKKWEDMKETIDRVYEQVLLMKKNMNEAERVTEAAEEEEEDNKHWKVG